MSDPSSAAPRLHPDWRHILRHAWSIRWLIAAGVLDGVEAVFSIFAAAPPIPLNVFAPLDFVVTAAAFWARLSAQASMTGARPECLD